MNKPSDIITQMTSERSGCLKVLGPLADLLAVRDSRRYEKIPTHMVKTDRGVHVEVPNNISNDKEYAEVIARTFRTGKAIVGNYDEESGKFITKEFDLNPSDRPKSKKRPD